jgi:ligand-binding sensor domain-containing protein
MSYTAMPIQGWTRRAAMGAALLLAGTSAHAAERAPPAGGHQYAWDVWESTQGLPQNSITAIVQSRQGYLWLGTYDGLVRFDGVGFTVFNQGNTPGLRSGRVRTLLEGRAGELWIGTEGGGLTRFQREAFTTFTAADGLGSDSVVALFEDSSSGLWATLHDGNLTRFHQGRFTTYELGKALPPGPLLAIHEDAAGVIWLLFPRQLARFAGATLRQVPVDGSSLTGGVSDDGAGGLWLGTERGLLRFQGGRFAAGSGPAVRVNIVRRDATGLWLGTAAGLTRIEESRSRTYRTADGLAQDEILGLVPSREGGLWVRTPAGLNRMRDGRIERIPMEGGPRSSVVRALLEDREGSLWVGTQGGGLGRLKPSVLTVFGREEGLPNDDVLPVLEARDGGLWVGTNGGGLSRLEDGRVTATYDDHNGFGGAVWSLYEDAYGALWVGTWGGGLIRFAGGRTTRFTRADGLAGDVVLALYGDREGTLWIGTWGGGLQSWREGRFTTYTTHDGLGNNFVRALHQDRQGDLWIATDGGVTRRDREGRFQRFTRRDGLSDDFVRAIHEDDEGTLWFGTYGNGLNRYRDGRFTGITTRDGLCEAGVSRILEDGQGAFWMTSNRGVFRVSRAELVAFADGRSPSVVCRSYGRAEGMRNAECNGGFQPAGVKGRDGRLFLPTVRGLAIVDPAHVRTNPVPPPVVIERALVHRQPAALAPHALFPPGTGELEFHYAGLSLLVPDKVRFRYRLEGFDPDWLEVGARRVAYYTNIPPGSYTFRVKACNNDGVWNEEGASFSFTLRPHFYESRWFYAIVFLALAAAAWGVDHLRVRRHERREQELQERVEKAMGRIKVLSGLLPICAWCKRIRDDAGYWNRIETFIHARSEADFTHGICPDCKEKVEKNDALWDDGADEP